MGMKELFLAKVNQLKNGEMKSIKVDDTEILLSRVQDKFYAVGAYCTHYGAPLEDGVLSGDRIICPWHHACFNANTGDLLEPPARDALPNYELKIDGEDIYVKLPQEISPSRTPQLMRQDLKRDNRTFIILGAGAAGYAAAQALREDGFQGRIVMITHEKRSPYDRPNLSKEYLQGEAEEEWMPLRGEEFYRENQIELMFGKRVKSVRVKEKKIVFSDNEEMSYDKILLASGGVARKLTIPGSDLQNIFTLRSFDDSDRIIAASQNASKVVIVGASFIGLETAHSLIHRKLPVTVVAPESSPFEHVFGKEIGDWFRELHESNRVTFMLEQSLDRFEGDGTVKSVVLKNGERLEADLVVVGIGVSPATGFLEDAELEADGSVKVDQYFQAVEDVYAAGDIATFPYWYSDSNIRIEHWRTAEQLGRMAAHNMAGKKTAYKSIPFFWTAQAGINFRYVGYAKKWDEIIVNGNMPDKKFIAYYVKNGEVQAAAGCNRDREMAAIEELMRLKKMPAPDKLKSETVDLVSLLKE
jgi:NADPH-dependent 2,4-dienoyl-CoA reductase/sulfur reductase-like enzyme/nitrite reductase/ring-hydroxylating ferredoxin subunit